MTLGPNTLKHDIIILCVYSNIIMCNFQTDLAQDIPRRSRFEIWKGSPPGDVSCRPAVATAAVVQVR